MQKNDDVIELNLVSGSDLNSDWQSDRKSDKEYMYWM